MAARRRKLPAALAADDAQIIETLKRELAAIPVPPPLEQCIDGLRYAPSGPAYVPHMSMLLVLCLALPAGHPVRARKVPEFALKLATKHRLHSICTLVN